MQVSHAAEREEKPLPPDTQTEALRSLFLFGLSEQCHPSKPPSPSTPRTPSELVRTPLTALTHHNLLGHRSRSPWQQMAAVSPGAWGTHDPSLLPELAALATNRPRGSHRRPGGAKPRQPFNTGEAADASFPRQHQRKGWQRGAEGSEGPKGAEWALKAMRKLKGL